MHTTHTHQVGCLRPLSLCSPAHSIQAQILEHVQLCGKTMAVIVVKLHVYHNEIFKLPCEFTCKLHSMFINAMAIVAFNIFESRVVMLFSARYANL